MGDEQVSEQQLRNTVYGELPMPRDVERIGDWEETPNGTMRQLDFPAAYSSPILDEEDETVPSEVRLIGQQLENGAIRYGVSINLVAAPYSASEAGLIGAAILGV